MRYKISFEFETDDKVTGLPIDWAWISLLHDLEDDYTRVDFETLAVFKQEWREMTDDD